MIAAEAGLLAIEVARRGVFAAVGLANAIAAGATIDGAVLLVFAAIRARLADTVTADARSAAIIRARIRIFAAPALTEPIAARAAIGGAVLPVLVAERIANTVAARAHDGAIAVAVALGFIALRLTNTVAAETGLSAIVGARELIFAAVRIAEEVAAEAGLSAIVGAREWIFTAARITDEIAAETVHPAIFRAGGGVLHAIRIAYPVAAKARLSAIRAIELVFAACGLADHIAAE